MRSSIALALGLSLLVGARAHAQQPRWFKGNTHSHAKTWLPIPHGDSSPRRMAGWYKEHGYQFLCLSDHDRVGREQRAADLVDAGFVLIAGSEITTDTRAMPLYRKRHPGAPARVVHTTALGIDPAGWDPQVSRAFGPQSSVADILLTHRQATERAGGFSIVNHPNFREPITPDDLIAAGVGLFEVHNAYPHARNGAGPQRLSTEQLWDAVLSRGHRLLGVASDDAHHTKRWNVWLTEEAGVRAEPGGGWIMVRAAQLTPAALLAAIRAGDFYASSGVRLATLESGPQRLALAIDLAASQAEATADWVWDAAEPVSEPPGARIEFVTRDGRVALAIDGPAGEVPLTSVTDYVRARVRLVVARGGETRAVYAWTQPVFVSAPSSTGLAGAVGGP